MNSKLSCVGLVLIFVLSACFFTKGPDGYRYGINIEGTKTSITECQLVVPFDEYLRGLSKTLKKYNVVCEHTNDVSTMAHWIDCKYFNGLHAYWAVWAETPEECERLRKIHLDSGMPRANASVPISK